MLSPEEITAILVGKDSEQQTIARAAALRKGENSGVYLRGLVEIGSYCRRSCGYCGLRAPNQAAARYRLSAAEIMAAAARVKACNIGTVVLQAGEDSALSATFIADIVARLSGELGLTVTLSLGERTPEELALWKKAGAARYLLRFETSNRELLDKIHPKLPGETINRWDLLKILRDLDYEVGSGFMVGIPGQTYDDLLNDILFCRKLDLDMIGIGPYVAHPGTPLCGAAPAVEGQVPATAAMTRLVLAILTILMPAVNLPSTTALATVNGGGARAYLDGLAAGANVVMPDFTPPEVREKYDIYPGKAAFVSAEDLVRDLIETLAAAGRPVATGAGFSRHYLERQGAPW